MSKEEWTTEEVLEDITKQLDLAIDNNNKDRTLLITRIKRKIRNIIKLVESNKKLHNENQQLKELLKEYKKQLSEIKNAYTDLTTQDEYGSYYIDEAKLFVEIVGKIIKDFKMEIVDVAED